MSNDNRRKPDSGPLEEEDAEDLMQTLVELNHSVNNINRLLQKLQKNIHQAVESGAKNNEQVGTRTLH